RLPAVPGNNNARKAPAEPTEPAASLKTVEVALPSPAPAAVESHLAPTAEKPRHIALPPLSASSLSSTPAGSGGVSAVEGRSPALQAPANPVPASKSAGAAPGSSLSLESLEESLLASLAKTLCMEQEEIHPNTPFINMGLDSVVGVEWVQKINGNWGLNITAATVYDHPTLRQFTAFIHRQIQGSSPALPPDSAVPPPASAPPSVSPHIAGEPLPESRFAPAAGKPTHIVLPTLSTNPLSAPYSRGESGVKESHPLVPVPVVNEGVASKSIAPAPNSS